MNRSTSRLSRFRRAIDGIAATEFAIFVPVFAFGLLTMVDVGLAISERMALDQALRAGAELAMANVDDTDTLENTVRAAHDADPNSYSVAVNQFCGCDGAAGSCTTLCANGEPPSIYIDFSASRTMETFLLPSFDVASTLRVQVR